jgi:prepilin-type N-terminal cleavage/methylation domain-containing protein
MKKNRQKGFSMIEMIIVIAIMGIFTALATIGFGYLKSGNVKAAAKTIDSNLTKLKLDTMSKDKKPYMCIYKVGSDTYMLCTTDTSLKLNASNGQKIGNGNVEIVANGEKLSGSKKIYVAFTKGSGSFAENFEKNPTVVKNPDSTIVVKSQKGTSYVIHMIRDTGKHYIELEK